MASIPDYLGDFAKAIEQHEPRSGTFTTTRTEYDGLGRPVTTTLAGTYVSRTEYDEAGNVLEQQRPGMNAEEMEYDARGLMLVRKRADGALIRMRYDELGTLRAYVDEENETTEYDVDGIGRVVRVRYPDGTTEATRYESGTGAVLARKDRAGQWIRYEYDSAGRMAVEHLAGTAAEPSITPDPRRRYEYDLGGRLSRMTEADAAVEYAEYDLLGRPGVTRLIRFARIACAAPSGFCGTGLTTGEVAERMGSHLRCSDGAPEKLPVVIYTV